MVAARGADERGIGGGEDDTAVADGPVFPAGFFEASDWMLADFTGLEEIGQGKDTVIYAADCARLGRRVAVKAYARGRLPPTKLRAIKREVAMMLFVARARVPHVVEFYGAWQDAERIYIAMELCPGGDLLEALIADRRNMGEARALREVAAPLLAALARLHALRIYHRDVKLENIFLDAAGRVRLGDFGLTMSARQEAAISPVGTVEYMAPEVVKLPAVERVTSGEVPAASITPTDEKVDIWALGVTLYELVTGRLPFEGADKAGVKAAIVAGARAPWPPHVTPPFRALVDSMLARAARDRPAAAALLAHPLVEAARRGRSGPAGVGAADVSKPVPAGGAVAVDARAGPAAPAPAPRGGGVGAAGGSSAGSSSSVVRSYRGEGESPPSRLSDAREAAWRELGGGGGGKGGAASARAGAGAWAALRRLSATRSPSGRDSPPGWERRGSAGERPASGGRVRTAVRRLFSRQSAHHHRADGAPPEAAAGRA